MKFFIINSFRTMVYVAYIAIIVAGIALGLYNRGEFTGELANLSGTMAQVADFVVFTVGGVRQAVIDVVANVQQRHDQAADKAGRDD